MTVSKRKSKFEIVRTVELEDNGIENDGVLHGEVVSREAPKERDFNKSMVVMPVMNDNQLSILLNRTPEWAVKKREGRAGQVYKYVTHGYVTDTLNKAFGFDWDLIIDPMFENRMYAIELEEIYNTKTKTSTTRRHIAICGHLEVRIHNPEGKHEVVATIKKSGFGSQEWLHTMEFGDALKGARSDLIKTCAYQLGIALDLYWNERAEISEFENIVTERELKKEADLKLQEQIKAGVPVNFASLLSKSKEQYGFDGEMVSNILGVTLDEMIEFEAEQCVEAWNKIIISKNSKDSKEEQ